MSLLKQYYQSLSERLENRYLSRYYLSIKELPIRNWLALHEENDLTHLLKVEGKPKKVGAKVLEMLQDEFIEVFGVDKNFSERLKKQIEIELLNIKIAITGDSSHKIFLEIAERELEQLAHVVGDKDVNGNTIAIEKFMGFKLNPKEITVFEYYSYIKTIEKAQKTV